MKFEKHLQSNYQNILAAKFYMFVRKSIFRYLVASILISLCFPGYLGGLILRTILIYLFLLIFGATAMFVSARRLSKTLQFDADIEFSMDEIIIKHRNKNLEIEHKDWSWVKKYTSVKMKYACI